MKVFEKMFQVSPQEDGSATISIVLDDSTIITKVVSRSQLQVLYIELEEFLKED